MKWVISWRWLRVAREVTDVPASEPVSEMREDLEQALVRNW